MLIDPCGEDLTLQIEAIVRDILGPVPLQTDFRRDYAGVADATVLIKTDLKKEKGDALSTAFMAIETIASARVSKQKLTIRFSDSFMEALVTHHLLSERGTTVSHSPHANRRILVDFCDPNANKALHVGHLRNVALGASIAALWQAGGATVDRQCVVCDIGRNVAEALAGLLAAGENLVLQRPEPLAPRLGQLYAQYVTTAAVSVGPRAEADAPIERELARHDDLAELVLDRWRDGDPSLCELWQRVIARVLGEQAATLERLGIRFERILHESDAIANASILADGLVACGIAFVDADGSYFLETGRADYARCPLTRTDGFPTEHLRALVLWDGLRDKLTSFDTIVHVMGQEWRTSTEIRIEALERLRTTNFAASYHSLSHHMVRLHGSDMKSSIGDVILIDDLCTEVEAKLVDFHWYGDTSERNGMLRACVLAPMLEVEPEVALDVSMELFLDSTRNPGFRIARVVGETKAASEAVPLSSESRYLVLQIARLERMVETAASKNRPLIVLKHILRLVDDRLSGALPSNADALLRIFILRGLQALGWRSGGRGE